MDRRRFLLTSLAGTMAAQVDNTRTRLRRRMRLLLLLSIIFDASPIGAADTMFGTAFLVHPDGLFLTSFHVVQAARSIVLSCPASEPVTAVLERASAPSEHDLATLRAVYRGRGSHLTLADNHKAAVGSAVFTVGYPDPANLGYEAKFTEGTISALSGFGGDRTRLQITVPIQPGNSGGPLVDGTGAVVGIVAASVAEREFQRQTGALPQNVNYAVKSEYARPLFGRPPHDAASQPPWIVGRWEGAHAAPLITTDASSFEFSSDDSRLRWYLTRRTTLRGWSGSLRASGVVTQLTATRAELEGTYEAFSEGGTAGKPLRYTLHWDGERLDGLVVGTEGHPFRVSLKPGARPGRSPLPDRSSVIRRVMEATCLVTATRD